MLRRSHCNFVANKRSTADCVIIGSGVIGCCTALELSRNPEFHGKRILVVDMNKKAGSGTTSWSSGILRSFYTVPQSVRVSYESYWIWKTWNDFIELPASSPDASYAPARDVKGWICRSKSSSEFLDKFIDCANQYSIKYRELDLAETKKIADQNGWDISKTYKPRSFEDPDFATPDPNNKITGSVLVPETGYVADPLRATTTVHDACLRSGKVEFSFSSKVVAIGHSVSKTSGKVRVSSVTLASGEVIETDCVINCAGPYSSAIQKLAFGSNAPVKDDTTLTCRPLRVECAILDGPEGLDCEKDGIVSFDCDTGFYMKPEGRGRVLVGGLDLKGDVMDYVSTDELPSTEVGGANHLPGDPAMLSCYRYALRVPSAKIPGTRNQIRGYTSSYDVTEDWSPIVDRTLIEGYYTNVGTSGNCFKTAPILGRLMSKIVTTPLSQDLSTAHLDLTLGGTKDNKLPLNCYKRDRNAFDIFGGVIG